MEKFSKTLHGYNPEEVNKFLDNIIGKVEDMVEENKNKDIKNVELQKENQALKQKLMQYERMEATLNKAMIMAEKTSEQIKYSAHTESEAMIEDARGKANRIINEALLKAEKAEQEANLLRRNINIFKRRVKDIIEAQMQVVDEMDDIEI
ncbi:MAG: DivIVA domain-containing protein [Bacilli bacterium]|nr:DivIVA domain-containing protein [Bacilli bacterium]